jgi:hypothetical protein
VGPVGRSPSPIPHWFPANRVTALGTPLVCLPATWSGAHRGLVTCSLWRRYSAAGGATLVASSPSPMLTLTERVICGGASMESVDVSQPIPLAYKTGHLLSSKASSESTEERGVGENRAVPSKGNGERERRGCRHTWNLFSPAQWRRGGRSRSFDRA